MAYVNSRWRRFTALGCTHGSLASKAAVRGALKFVDEWKPETRIHGGDINDLSALRSGAKGTRDECEPLDIDLNAGKRFLEDYRATHAVIGNHDARAYKLMNHPNAIISRAACSIVNELRETARTLKCDLRETWSIRDPKAQIRIGDTSVIHGWFYNVMAARDHAESFGKCIFFHTHTVAVGVGRCKGSPIGYNAGSLADFDALDYASARRQTLAWRAGLAFGEYNDKEARVWLVEADDKGYFHLPR